MQNTLYWTGNVAKARIVSLVMDDPRPTITVFDYGAGRGGDWARVLQQKPGIKLVCYEPDPDATVALKAALAAHDVRVLTDGELEAGAVQADYIVSFSVLEHVFDRSTYLAHAKRHLARDGIFYLNYDDGHFRTSLDLDELRGWRPGIAVTLQNRLAWLWPRLNKLERYQARVARGDIDALIASKGFAITDDRYENLDALKQIAKTIPPDRQEEFCRFWMATEDELNRRFRFDVEPRMGDGVNLWREMGSRTLVLKHS